MHKRGLPFSTSKAKRMSLVSPFGIAVGIPVIRENTSMAALSFGAPLDRRTYIRILGCKLILGPRGAISFAGFVNSGAVNPAV
jgi:hypothetical protein